MAHSGRVEYELSDVDEPAGGAASAPAGGAASAPAGGAASAPAFAPPANAGDAEGLLDDKDLWLWAGSKSNAQK